MPLQHGGTFSYRCCDFLHLHVVILYILRLSSNRGVISSRSSDMQCNMLRRKSMTAKWWTTAHIVTTWIKCSPPKLEIIPWHYSASNNEHLLRQSMLLAPYPISLCSPLLFTFYFFFCPLLLFHFFSCSSFIFLYSRRFFHFSSCTRIFFRAPF